MKQFLSAILIVLSGTIATSCNKPVICSEEFRIVAITVDGPALTDYYTIRESTNTVIRHNDKYSSEDHWYPVLTDDYQPNMVKRQEVFRFIGMIGTEKVVEEEFVIKADKCHISRISGREKVSVD